MATLFVTEYARAARDGDGRTLPTGEEPAIATQTISLGASSASIAANLNASTRLVRLHTDAACSFVFAKTPTATTDDARLAADQSEWRGVSAIGVAEGLKVAAIVNP